MIKTDFSIDRSSSITICEQLVNEITKRITDGDLDIGEKLPTERELSESLNISRGTIKKAYSILEKENIIEIRKGSGSYVLCNNSILEESQKSQASLILSETFQRLGAMGLSQKEILNIINLQLSDKTSLKKVSIMVVSNNYEILLKLENQLSYLSNKYFSHFTLSFFTLDSIASMPNPSEMLLGYDLIIASVIDYPSLTDMVPMFIDKIMKVSITPVTRTLVALSSLPKNSRLCIIYRTDSFKNMATDCLLKLGFNRSNLFTVNEHNYSPSCIYENKIDSIINFNESPVYTDPSLKKSNEDFLIKGGNIIHFEYCIDRKSLLSIEDHIQKTLVSE